MDFYIVLSSVSSKDYYPDNGPFKFTTVFNPPIHIPNGTTVALVEVNCRTTKGRKQWGPANKILHVVEVDIVKPSLLAEKETSVLSMIWLPHMRPPVTKCFMEVRAGGEIASITCKVRPYSALEKKLNLMEEIFLSLHFKSPSPHPLPNQSYNVRL